MLRPVPIPCRSLASVASVGAIVFVGVLIGVLGSLLPGPTLRAEGRPPGAGGVPSVVSSSSPSASSSPAPSTALLGYTDTVEKDFALRSLGELRVSNARGEIRIEGWSQDKIRLKAVRRTRAESAAKARQNFAATDFALRAEGRDIELAVEYGKGMSIEDRLRERRSPETFVDIVVSAPSSLGLRVWASEGSVWVKSWNAPLDVRTAQGAIRIENTRKGPVSLICPECEISVKSAHGALRCMGGAGHINLHDVSGGPVYVESDAGAVSLGAVQGEQLYVTKRGTIDGNGLSGRIEFHTESGNVRILGSTGFLSGRSESGAIVGQMLSWEFLDKALLESEQGSVQLALPSNFSGDVDLQSEMGKVMSAFPVVQMNSRRMSPERLAVVTQSSYPGPGGQRLTGVVRDGGELLKLASRRRDVSLLKSE
jgi:hypothetical protein